MAHNTKAPAIEKNPVGIWWKKKECTTYATVTRPQATGALRSAVEKYAMLATRTVPTWGAVEGGGRSGGDKGIRGPREDDADHRAGEGEAKGRTHHRNARNKN